MKAVFGVLLAALAVGIAIGSQSMSFSNLMSPDFYKSKKTRTAGAALAIQGSYNLLTKALLRNKSAQLGMYLIQRSLSASLVNPTIRTMGGLSILALNRYYTNQPYYLNKK